MLSQCYLCRFLRMQGEDEQWPQAICTNAGGFLCLWPVTLNSFFVMRYLVSLSLKWFSHQGFEAQTLTIYLRDNIKRTRS
jgi:hypothetical protein